MKGVFWVKCWSILVGIGAMRHWQDKFLFCPIWGETGRRWILFLKILGCMWAYALARLSQKSEKPSARNCGWIWKCRLCRQGSLKRCQPEVICEFFVSAFMFHPAFCVPSFCSGVLKVLFVSSFQVEVVPHPTLWASIFTRGCIISSCLSIMPFPGKWQDRFDFVSCASVSCLAHNSWNISVLVIDWHTRPSK